MIARSRKSGRKSYANRQSLGSARALVSTYE